jgi:hypothetical protein
VERTTQRYLDGRRSQRLRYAVAATRIG